MNDLNPLAIATQGIGFSPLLVAVQGLWVEEVDEDIPPPRVVSTSKRRHLDNDDDVLIFLL